MNEYQANAMLELLELINNRLARIDEGMYNITSKGQYNLGDVCNGIDHIIHKM